MEKNKAIPEGYMTVGELAKKMNTTVRTLQYYDKLGLLSPSAESEGGRRLYTERDIFKLHQILAMKYLDFSLEDIKTRLADLDTPEQVAAVLTEQAKAIREKIASLSDVLDTIEKLRSETLQIKTVDFKKYADIIVNLQMKNEWYGLVKYMDETVIGHFQGRFDIESATAFINTLNQLCERSETMQKNGIPPESVEGKTLGKDWWNLIMEFTEGDVNLLTDLVGFAEQMDSWDEKLQALWSHVSGYLELSMIAYFQESGIDPFKAMAEP